jgi:hypothetical protein
MKKIFTLALLSMALQNLQAQNCVENTNSITFDGFSTYASPSNQTNLNITDSLTIEAWIYPVSFAFNSANNSIVCKHGWSNTEGGFVLRCGGSGELSFNIAGLDQNQNPTSWIEVLSPTNALILNTWNHVAGSFDGQNLKCYVNGIEQNTTSFTGTIVSSPDYPLTIGKLSDPGQFSSRFFDGKIDEVRIWHRVVPAAEIMANMSKHIDAASSNNLISYWRFNEGTGTTSIDLKSGNDATLNNSSWDTLVPFNVTFPTTPIISYNTGVLSASTSGQWNLNGTAIPNATNFTFTPTTNGSYTFTSAPNQFGCTSTSNEIIVNDVSVNELNNDVYVNLYPNPIENEAIVAVSTSKNYNNVAFAITDIAGRQVYINTNLTIKNGLNQININKNNLTQGIYFYEFTSNTQSIAKGKLMVK